MFASTERSAAWMVCAVLAAGTSAARGDVLYIVSNTSNEVFRYDVNPTGTPTQLSTVTHASLTRPFGVSMRPGGDLIVTSRGSCTGCGQGGVSSFASACGVPGAARTPLLSGFNTPHDAAMRGDELFVVGSYDSKLHRIRFDAAGAPLLAGQIPVSFGADGRGITMWAGNDEALVSVCCGTNGVRRFKFDADGALSEAGFISGNGINNPHGLVVGPGDELFVANHNGSSVSRFLLTPTGAVANGVITGNGLNTPIGVAFTPWGELLVSNGGDASVRRFTFDGSGQAVANGGFSTPAPVDDMVFVTGSAQIARHPRSAFTCPGGELTLSVVAVGANSGAPFQVQWRHDGEPIPGGTGLTYTIPAATPDDAGSYDCVITNSCGGGSAVTSLPAVVSLCAVDLNCDGVVDFGDYLEFLNRYDAQDPSVDFNQDGLVDFSDYLEFLNLYDGGC